MSYTYHRNSTFLAWIIGENVCSPVIVDSGVVCRASSTVTAAASLCLGLVVHTAAGGATRRLRDWRGRERRDGERYRSDAARVDDGRNARRGGGSGGGGAGRGREHTAECRRDGRTGCGTTPGDHCLVEFLQKAVHRCDPAVSTTSDANVQVHIA